MSDETVYHTCEANPKEPDSGYEISGYHGSWHMIDLSRGNYYAIKIIFCPFCGVGL